MRIHIIALAAMLAAGCAAQNDDTVAAPVTDTPAPKQPAPSEPSPIPQPSDSAAVPAQFQGDYAADVAACTSPGHVTRLSIGASRIEFHESSGDITAVDSNGNDIDITAELTGEGETRESTYSFTLSDDGQTLTDTAHGMARQRCP